MDAQHSEFKLPLKCNLKLDKTRVLCDNLYHNKNIHTNTTDGKGRQFFQIIFNRTTGEILSATWIRKCNKSALKTVKD